jgi:hypothetical protein
MRAAAIVASAFMLGLAACSFGSPSSETTKNGYVGTSSMNAGQVTQLLHNQGYTGISNLHKNGNDWVGSAVGTNGTSVDFDIDQAGVIHTK